MRADARRNLERILRAARECFAEAGLDVGVAEIARRAEVGTATIFRRFETKDDLIAAIMAERVAELEAVARDATDLRTFMEVAIQRHIDDRVLIEGFVRSGGVDNPEIRRAREALHDEVGMLLAAARDRGEVRGDLVAADVSVLVNAVARIGQITDETLPGFWRRYLAIVYDGMGGSAPLDGTPPTLDDLDDAVRASSP